MDPEVVVATRYDTAVRTAVNFLSVFLGKCGVKNNEEVDYRPLFENFVQVKFVLIPFLSCPIFLVINMVKLSLLSILC